MTNLETYKEAARSCTSCREQNLIYRHDDGRWAYPLFHDEGTCRAKVLIVAEAPNFDDTFDQGKGRLTVDPDTDPSGKFLCELLASVGLAPSDVLCTNGVLCLPAKKDGKFPVYAAQRKMCLPWLVRLTSDVDPGVVVTLGGEALNSVKMVERHELKLKTDVGKMHDWYRRKLLPLYHPSLLGRVTRKAEQQKDDILALVPYLTSIVWECGQS